MGKFKIRRIPICPKCGSPKLTVISSVERVSQCGKCKESFADKHIQMIESRIPVNPPNEISKEQ